MFTQQVVLQFEVRWIWPVAASSTGRSRDLIIYKHILMDSQKLYTRAAMFRSKEPSRPMKHQHLDPGGIMRVTDTRLRLLGYFRL